jgi:uncharacterized DUF497 family protein
VAIVWDPEKLKANIEKHGVRFRDAVPVLEDPRSITISDYESDPDEEGLVTWAPTPRGASWSWLTHGAAAISVDFSPARRTP